MRARQAFESGKVAFTITTEAETANIGKAGIDWGMVTSLKGKERGTFVATDSLVMLKGCEDKQLCYDLMSFITEGPQMEKMHSQMAFPPVGKDEKTSYAPELLKIYSEDAAILHGLPVVANGVPGLQRALQEPPADAQRREDA